MRSKYLPAVLATVALSGTGLAACGEDEEEATRTAPDPAGAGVVEEAETAPEPVVPDQITAQELFTSTELYVGERVEVVADVQDADIDEDPQLPAVFSIGADDNEEIPVLVTEGADIPASAIVDGETVQVQGRVVELGKEVAAEESLLYETLGDDSFLTNLDSRYAIVANYALPTNRR